MKAPAAMILAGGGAITAAAIVWRRTVNHYTPRAVLYARHDYARKITSAMPDKNSPLAEIFRLSGWSNYVHRVDGSIMDWCGMAVATWLHLAGLRAEDRRTFWHTDGVRAFFSYGRTGSTRRLVATRDGQSIESVHRTQKKQRRWIETAALRAVPLDEWDLQPGDVVLIAHQGQTTHANHIALVESFARGRLTTLEGNASGVLANGQTTSSGVVRKTRNLKDVNVRNTIFGIGRCSPLDFATQNNA